jgi:N-acetyl sugar amidotransferase
MSKFEMLRYCKLCLMPDSRPSLRFDSNGVCSACSWYSRNIEHRSFYDNPTKSLHDLITANKINPAYDCIIPVSGGKDSTYQVWRLLSLGLNPLCVTAPTDYLTPLGRRNLDNLKSMGVDHIEFSVDISTRRKINRYALEKVGDIQWPEHVLIFTIPVHAALMFKIPIIIWGENSVREYGIGRSVDQQLGTMLDRRYMEENCGFNGLRVTDLASSLNIHKSKLYLYTYPDADAVESLGIKGIFLDDYFPWNGMSNQLIAKANGFECAQHNILGTLSNYENLDNYYHGIHDYLKYLKYGYGRATDLACNWIRRKLLSREDAIEIVSQIDGAYPHNYLGKNLQSILDTIEVDLRQFNLICDEFTNYSYFMANRDGTLLLREDGSPTLNRDYSKHVNDS